MKLVTFNIRCDFGQDGENNFEYRKDLILKKIAQEKPDMICFQEVLPHIAKWLKENLTEYYVIGCGRGPELRDEQVSIAYRKDRLNLMEMQSYWLSETPYVPASRYAEQSICPRICNEALFEDLETGKVFRIVNTHLDHIGAQARILGLRQILALSRCTYDDHRRFQCRAAGPGIRNFKRVSGIHQCNRAYRHHLSRLHGRRSSLQH